jgi:hypothetical protein
MSFKNCFKSLVCQHNYVFSGEYDFYHEGMTIPNQAIKVFVCSKCGTSTRGIAQ